jgi:methyltransferase (TIGR00027 family)
MGSDSPIIEDISDTARWVAMYRALETDRPDAHFRDPYARLLAGERGETIVRKMPGFRFGQWPMVVRTCVFDELILRCIEQDGADTVLNLAAGLDARPYRLPLPSSLHWVEVDFPAMISYKDGRLSGESPRCRRESVKLDLSEVSARRALFERIGASARKAVVVTEGLLAYLTEDQVASLADDLHAQASFRWWIIDLASPALMKRLQKTYGKTLAEGQARMQFAPAAGTEFFRPRGWGEAEFRSTWDESRRLKREMPGAWFFRLLARFSSPRRREEFRRMGASVLLERIDSRIGNKASAAV